jgi:hypothetical protein
MELAEKNNMKSVYGLHRFWTSISARGRMTEGRMTEVLTPDILYFELTGVNI